MRRPRHTLAHLSEQGGKKWLLMAALAMILVVLQVVIAAPITTRIAQEAMAAQFEAQRGQVQEVTPEMQQQISQFATNPVFTVVFPSGGAIASLWIGWVVWAGVLHLGSTMLGGNSRFGQMWQVVVWSWFPYALRGLLQAGFILITGEVITNPGLSGLVAAEGTVTDMLIAPAAPGRLAMRTLFSGIDLFLVWNLILLSIGVMAAARLSVRKAIVITLGVWAVLTLLSVLTAVVPSLLFAGSF